MRKRLSVFMTILIVFMALVPSYSQNIEEQITITLTEGINEITTKGIQRIVMEGKNQTSMKNDFHLVMALVDYKGKIINYITSKESLDAQDTSQISTYTKIVSGAYKIQIFAWNNLNDRNMISNMVEIPIKNEPIVEEILKINDVNTEIQQYANYELPKEVIALMNNGMTKSVSIKWDIESVDTSKTGVFVILGNVIGYKGQKVILNLTIKPIETISSIDDLNITINMGEYFKLPSTVLATFSSGEKVNVPVLWDSNVVDTKVEGLFTFEGKVEGYEPKVILNLKVEKVNLGEEIVFVNSELEDIIRENINKPKGNIFHSDLLEITELNLDWQLYENFNIEDLKYLKNLEVLSLGHYEYNFDLMSLQNLTKLKEINLFGNEINNVNPLKNLNNLTKLNLGLNEIHDISALTGLTNLVELKLTDNPIKDYSPTATYYDNLINKDFELNILKANYNNNIEVNIDIGETFTIPYGIKLSDGKIVFVDWEKKEIVGVESGLERVKGKVIDSQVEIYLECNVGENELDYIVNFGSQGLESAIRAAIDKSKGDIYYSDIKNLKELNVMGLGITNISGIENLKGLEKLSLWGNNIDSSQLRYLKGMKNMVYLDLALNKITYVPANAFENMTNLFELVLDENQIVEIKKDAFKGLENLSNLLIEENRISDITEVNRLTNLDTLYMRYNIISDISPVENLTKLTSIWASNNRISDISALTELKEMDWLALEKNNIKDISPLSGMTKLRRLRVGWNRITTLAPLSDMLGLEWLIANDNEISNVDGVKDLIMLNWLDLKNNKITNIEALRKLNKLTILHLSGNKITDFSPVDSYYDTIKNKDF